ncbi:hypothetical protein [Devosia sediminis]|uniref:Uncharacterized protein n=1 Tax=Devosia sediminis TaxID=2798801 RepID=A0A934INU2_9HYPH|nr:hypothetical protein [Devosia sediminis]MBJ3784149.1 hypothetical protein [Devosia sediminis]
MIRSALAALAVSILGLVSPLAQDDAIGIPGPIEFEGVSFDLVWTSHPTDTDYKQEYLPAGQAVEAYQQMFMIDLMTDGPTPDVAANAMVQSLEQRRANDPVVNFEVIRNTGTGEVILDFVLSSDDGEMLIVEWNAYRYVPTDSGLAMFGISRRGYDDEVTDFLTNLKSMRQPAIEALAFMEVPGIVIE